MHFKSAACNIFTNSMLIYYYESPSGKNLVSEFINSLQYKQRAKIRRVLFLIQEYGIHPAIPHIKKLSGVPLWEIRIPGKDSIRMLYVIIQKNTVLVLHGFIKKAQKTTSKEITIALNRYQEWISRKGIDK